MEMDRKKAIIIAVILLTSTTLAVGAQNGWFSFIYDPGDVIVDDTLLEEALELKELPQWFTADVSIAGSGYTDQEHTVSLSIYHNRPDNSIPWYAYGSYSLDLKLAGEIVEPILSGSFMDLKMWDLHTDSRLWTPAVEPDNYTIAISITGVSWMEVPTYTITATAGLGGSIAPPGATVLEGDPQGFNINPDLGYVIEGVLVDGFSVGPVSSYLFEDVTEDHTIVASFSQTVAEYSSGYTYSSWDTQVFSVLSATYDGDANHTYLGGETVNYVVNAKNDDATFTAITYEVQVRIHDGTYVILLTGETNTYGSPINALGEFTITGSFVQPSGESGYWDLRIQITGTTP